MKGLIALLRGDARTVARDPLLAWIPLLPFLLIIAARLLIPLIADLLREQVDLPRYYPFITAFFLLIVPLMVGMVAGFILLDERDENVLIGLGVTPLTKGGFLVYRLAAPTFTCFLMNLVLAGGLGLVPFPGPAILLPVLIASLEAPLLALYLGAFAGNKVEGLVLAKASGILDLAPLAILFVPMPWQLAAGMLPTYWVARSYLAIGGSAADYWLSAAAGLAWHAVLLLYLLRRFDRRAG